MDTSLWFIYATAGAWFYTSKKMQAQKIWQLFDYKWITVTSRMPSLWVDEMFHSHQLLEILFWHLPSQILWTILWYHTRQMKYFPKDTLCLPAGNDIIDRNENRFSGMEKLTHNQTMLGENLLIPDHSTTTRTCKC